MKKYEIN